MKVICPICNKEYASLMIHVKRSHKLTREELLEKYPGTKLISEELSARKSEIMSERNLENWKNEEYRERNQRQYEFKYSFDNHIRTYRPDFYLPSLDLFVEIKANYLIDSKVIEKLNCVRKLSKMIYLITEDHLWDDDLIDKITNKTFLSM